MKKYIRPEVEYIEFYSEEEITGAFGETSANVTFGSTIWGDEEHEKDTWK